MTWYRFVQWSVRTLWPVFVGKYHAEGLHHVPEHGPFILVSNHQSYLDPVLLQAVVRRPLHTMAKSTQFSNPVVAAFIKSLKSYPVRRFEIDPQAVRLTLRYLDQGHGVGVYIEGERTWDGLVQPPRLGTVRLILKAGVPVVPCGISGAYDVWPRWAGRFRRGDITIRCGPALRFPKLDRREDRETRLAAAAEAISKAVTDLVDPGPRAGG